MSGHDLTRREFSKQAELYAAAPQITDVEAVARLVRLAALRADDELLDVACGTGVVACGFAPHVRRAVGIDLTLAMLRRAQALGAQRGVGNVRWVAGDVARLPFPDGAFSLVTSRYAVHHFRDARAVLAEMRRVARPEGRILVADVAASEDRSRADAFNAMERLRDPSHVRALSASEMAELLGGAGLAIEATLRYRVEFELEAILAGSFPVPGGAERIRAMFREGLESDALGVGAHRAGEEIRFAYPITAWLARRPADVRSSRRNPAPATSHPCP